MTHRCMDCGSDNCTCPAKPRYEGCKAPRVEKHLAEKFIDWYPTNTKLYLRGERGADHKKMGELNRELFKALVAFFDKHEVSWK